MTRAAELLDASVLIAAVSTDHPHHAAAEAWLVSNPAVALCPITEGALVRFLVRTGENPRTIATVLADLHRLDGVEFWPDSVSYRDMNLDPVRGHRQVTDSYLVALAAAHESRVVTFDNGLALAHPAHTVHLVPDVHAAASEA